MHPTCSRFAMGFSSRWVFLVSFVAFVTCSEASSGADSPAWDLRTDDTEIRIGVVDQRPVVQRLAAAGVDAQLDRHARRRAADEQGLARRPGNAAGLEVPASRVRPAGRAAYPDVFPRRSAAAPAVHLAGPCRPGTDRALAGDRQSVGPGRVTVSHQDSLSLRDAGSRRAGDLWWIKRGGGNASTQGGTFTSPWPLVWIFCWPATARTEPVRCLGWRSKWAAAMDSTSAGNSRDWDASTLRQQAANPSGSISMSATTRISRRTSSRAKCSWSRRPLSAVTAATWTKAATACIGSCWRSCGRRCRRAARIPILAYNLYLDVGGNKATEADVLRSAAVLPRLGIRSLHARCHVVPGDRRLALGSAAFSSRHPADRGVRARCGT